MTELAPRTVRHGATLPAAGVALTDLTPSVHPVRTASVPLARKPGPRAQGAQAPTAQQDAALDLPPRRVPLARRLSRVVAVVALCDVLVLALTAFIAVSFRARLDGVLEKDTYLEFALLSGMTPFVFLLWLVCLALGGAYARRNLGGGTEEFRRVAIASLMAVGAVGTVSFLSRSNISRGYVILCFAVGTVLLLSTRYAVRKVLHHLRQTGRLHARVVAVCSPTALDEVKASLERLSWAGYTLVGACVPSHHLGELSSEPSVPILGGSDDIVAACELTGADTVLVAGGGHTSSQALRRIGWQLETLDVDLVVVPGLIDVAGPRIHMRQVGGLPLVHVDKPQVGRAGGLVKRIFDVVVASAMLVVLSPLMALIALAIKLQDGGPVFYRQTRSGRDGGTFRMLKFRSMVVDADRRLAEVAAMNEADGVLFKVKDDPRITRLGHFLRKFSLDELPQLVNVLSGEMSVVGPRPPLPAEVEDYPVDMHRRLLVRPGLTGLWQVSGRSDLSFDEAVRMDLYYVDNWSLIGDVIIMLKTVRAVLLGRGAY
ncbi:sugar transferase [Nocardioides sp. Root140]|uniref:sugar transferase n=1 Tax=Nocardioides sp. Root140 TaxID=1736460 RepID=UPI0006F80EDD|nr:sugar transferase [Nocardioides sp. Root140]KQY50146.1 hypothetical protein ASD30_21705 [Nocardioides sp. Root140]